MPGHRRIARVDSNQSGIVKALRKMGYTVALDHDDILVGHRGRTFWYELKESEQASKAKSKTVIAQHELANTWRGHYKIVWSLEMILEDIKGVLDGRLRKDQP